MKRLALLLSLAALPTLAAEAQSFYWNSASANSVALGGAYVPSSAGALDAIATNPAGLSELKRPVLNLSAAAEFARGSFSNSANTNAPMRTAPGVVPMGAFAMPIGKTHLTLGVAEMPELTTVSKWYYTDAPGTAGATYGFQENRSAILATRSAAAASYTFGSHVAIGATVGVDYNSNALHGPYIFQSQPVVKGLKTLLDLHTNGTGVNGSVGVLVNPSKHLRLGASWKSKTTIHSTGTATGNIGAQLIAAGLAGARPDFAYAAAVPVTLPQSATADVIWNVKPRWTVAFQGEWIDWKLAFNTLDVHLTQGNNADINGLLGSSSLNDGIPLDWKSQYPVRIGVERTVSESAVVRAGFAHTNNAVPASTVMPLTAAIFCNQISAGAGWHRGRLVLDGAYAYTPNATETTGVSLLQAGEYSHSRISVGLQTVTASASFVF